MVIFLVTLDGDGLCTEFREWWNSPRGQPLSTSCIDFVPISPR